MENKAQAFWDKQAKRYDVADSQFERVYREIFLRTKIYLEPEDRVLDFGCATGNKTIELAGMVKHAQGLDFSKEMIGEALKKIDERQVSNVSFSSGTIYSKELKAGSFDKVIAYSVIHLLEEDRDVIARIHQLLRSGGLFISATPCFKDRMELKKRLQFSMVFLMNRFGLFPLHLNKYRTKDLKNLVSREGFQVVASETIFHEMSICFLVAKKMISE